MPEALPTTCPVCNCPCRREVDIMLVQGFSADEVCDTLPEAPRRPLDVKAHQYAGHVLVDLEGVITATIQVAQDIRKADQLLVEVVKDGRAAGARTTGAMTEWQNRQNQRSIVQANRESVNLRLRYLEFLSKLVGLIGRRPEGESADITNNTLNIAIAGDPELPLRIAKAQLESAGFEIRKARKKVDAA